MLLRSLKFVIAAAVVAVAGSSAASAADMPVRAYTKAPPMVVMSMYNWSGLYAGLNAGGAWNRSGSNNSGFIGGGQIGYNWQFSQLVLGVETDFQGSTQRSSFAGAGFTGDSRISYFGTVRGRIGYAWDRWMVYGTGGYAYVNQRQSLTVGALTGSSDNTRGGGTIGAGLEWAFWDRWSAKLEYLYIATRSNDLTVGAVTTDGRVRENVVRVGINYHF